MKRHQCGHQPAFTLIELLVVISIIALLIGILLPALSSARQTARAMQCMSGVRQIMLAQEMYANEHNGFYTTTYGADQAAGSDDPTVWLRKLHPYISKDGGIGEAGSNTALADGGFILRCPDARPPVGAPDAPDAYQTNGYTYGLNYFMATDSPGAQWRFNREAVPNPSSIITLGDQYERTDELFFPPIPALSGSNPTATYPGFRHGGARGTNQLSFSGYTPHRSVQGDANSLEPVSMVNTNANMAFADGHAQARDEDSMISTEGSPEPWRWVDDWQWW